MIADRPQQPDFGRIWQASTALQVRASFFQLLYLIFIHTGNGARYLVTTFIGTQLLSLWLPWAITTKLPLLASSGWKILVFVCCFIILWSLV